MLHGYQHLVLHEVKTKNITFMIYASVLANWWYTTD